MSLTPPQIDQFKEDGFLVIDDLFASGEVDELREACEAPSVVEAQSSKGFEEKTVHLLSIKCHVTRSVALCCYGKRLLFVWRFQCTRSSNIPKHQPFTNSVHS